MKALSRQYRLCANVWKYSRAVSISYFVVAILSVWAESAWNASLWRWIELLSTFTIGIVLAIMTGDRVTHGQVASVNASVEQIELS